MSFSPTIRLFVSSTFSDLKAERNVLQDEVFPRLRQLCLTKGFRFQAIDLRWGISEEAGRDNKTMRICLRELRRCQQDRPKPNFLILLGDRYGWRPLPEIIPAALFEKLAAYLQAAHPHAAQLLERWYRLDNNAVPPVHELQPRGDDTDWAEQVEKPLLAALEHAGQALGLDLELELEKAGVSIGASATEQEIIAGALKVSDAASHVRAFFRTIDGLPDNPPPKDYLDIGDPQAKPRQGALIERIKMHLGNDSVCSYRVPWRGDGINRVDLKEFGDQAWKRLSEVVEQQIAALTNVPPEVLEEQAHEDFGAERRHRFVGRDEPLNRMADYLIEGSDQPLTVIGPSGSGKSALMAKAVQAAAETHPTAQIIARYIGATPASSDLIQLLRNLVAGIRRRYQATVAAEPESGEGGQAKPDDAEIPFEFNTLVSAFHDALTRPTVDQPLFLFLDSLDQLTASHQAHALTWLPGRLSENVRVVVSAALPSEHGTGAPFVSIGINDPRAAVVAALKSRLDASQSVALSPLSVANGEQMLTNWLADACRTLQPAQRQAILEPFQVEGSPLWLRTATEESARLASWQPAPSFASTTPGLLGQVLDRLSQEDEHGEMLVSRTLSYLACARHGLAEDEILDILGADPEVMADFLRRSPTERSISEADRVKTLPVAVWVRLHGDLAFYLAEHHVQGEHQAQGVSLLGFYHRSFLEAVAAYCLATAEARRLRHQQLSDWFGKQAWFLAPASEDPSVPLREARIEDPPNARKASELPWHLYKTADESDPQRCKEAVWQPLAEALCDIVLVESKVRSGLVFELQEDYRLVLDALPEIAPEMKERQKREAHIQRWAEETVAYARAWSERGVRQARGELVPEPEPVLPEPVSACRMWTQEEIEGESRRISDQPARLDRLSEFAGFVEQECYTLLEYGSQSGFIVQHAFNHNPRGPVFAAAEAVLSGVRAVLLIRHWTAKDSYVPKPALLRTLQGHKRGVNSVCVTSDSRRVISASDDKTLRVWDLETGACLRVLEGHWEEVWDVSVTPDSSRAVSGGWDRTVRIWDLETGTCLRAFKLHENVLTSMTPDGLRAVSTGHDGPIRVWNLETGAYLQVLEEHADSVSVTVTPDGRRALSGGGDGTVRVWDLVAGACQTVLEGHTDKVFGVSVTPDGKRAVSASKDKTLRVWDLVTGTCLTVLEGHTDMVRRVSVTPDGKRAVSASWDKTLRVWDLETWACLRVLKGHWLSIEGVSVTPDGRRAVSGGEDRTVRVWDLEAGASMPELERHTNFVLLVFLAPDGRRAVSFGHDNALRVWDLETGVCLHVLECYMGEVCRISVTPDVRRAIHAIEDVIEDHKNTLGVLDLETGVCLRRLAGHTDRILGVAVTPDGQRAVSTSQDGTVRVWDLETGNCLRVLEGHRLGDSSPSVTPDGRLAILALERHPYEPADFRTVHALTVLDLETGEFLRILEGHTGRVKGVSVTPDGGRAVSFSDDRTVRVWDMDTGECLRILEGHTGSVLGGRVTPDGRRAVSFSDDNTLRVWDLQTGACLRVLEGHVSLQAHVSWVTGVIVTPDSRRAISFGLDSTLRVWDLASGTCVALFFASSPIVSAAVCSSAPLIVYGTSEGEVVFLRMHDVARGPLN